MGKKISERLERVDHKGRTIFYSDYRGLIGKAFAEAVKTNAEIAMKLGEKNQLRLTDVRDTVVTTEAMDALKESGALLKPYIKATAVVGIEGMRKHLLSLVNKVSGLGAKPFDTVEAAKEWLVTQGDT